MNPADRGTRSPSPAGRPAAEAAAGAEPPPPLPPFTWISADLGLPLVDLEDREAVNGV